MRKTLTQKIKTVNSITEIFSIQWSAQWSAKIWEFSKITTVNFEILSRIMKRPWSLISIITLKASTWKLDYNCQMILYYKNIIQENSIKDWKLFLKKRHITILEFQIFKENFEPKQCMIWQCCLVLRVWVVLIVIRPFTVARKLLEKQSKEVVWGEPKKRKRMKGFETQAELTSKPSSSKPLQKPVAVPDPQEVINQILKDCFVTLY